MFFGCSSLVLVVLIGFMQFVMVLVFSWLFFEYIVGSWCVLVVFGGSCFLFWLLVDLGVFSGSCLFLVGLGGFFLFPLDPGGFLWFFVAYGFFLLLHRHGGSKWFLVSPGGSLLIFVVLGVFLWLSHILTKS